MTEDDPTPSPHERHDKTACDACGDHGGRFRYGLILCAACEEGTDELG